jgi:hypothetical protein
VEGASRATVVQCDSSREHCGPQSHHQDGQGKLEARDSTRVALGPQGGSVAGAAVRPVGQLVAQERRVFLDHCQGAAQVLGAPALAGEWE